MRVTRFFMAAIAATLVFSFAPAASAGNLQEQALGVTAQLNGNCTASLIWSDRDKVTGDVTTMFLTAKHCVEDVSDADMTIDLPVYQKGRVVKKDRYTARVFGQHYKSDLALVVLKDKQTYFAKTAKIAPKDGVPAMGDPVVTVGYPLGLQLTVTSGLFGSLETLDVFAPGEEYFRATPSVVGGNSGGAMYRLTAAGDYELIGVTAAGHQIHSFIAFYTPLDPIHEYLKAALPGAIGIVPDAAKAPPASN